MNDNDETLALDARTRAIVDGLPPDERARLQQIMDGAAVRQRVMLQRALENATALIPGPLRKRIEKLFPG